jgi:hypothetical protein
VPLIHRDDTLYTLETNMTTDSVATFYIVWKGTENQKTKERPI